MSEREVAVQVDRRKRARLRTVQKLREEAWERALTARNEAARQDALSVYMRYVQEEAWLCR